MDKGDSLYIVADPQSREQLIRESLLDATELLKQAQEFQP